MYGWWWVAISWSAFTFESKNKPFIKLKQLQKSVTINWGFSVRLLSLSWSNVITELKILTKKLSLLYLFSYWADAFNFKQSCVWSDSYVAHVMFWLGGRYKGHTIYPWISIITVSGYPRPKIRTSFHYFLARNSRLRWIKLADRKHNGRIGGLQTVAEQHEIKPAAVVVTFVSAISCVWNVACKKTAKLSLGSADFRQLHLCT